MTAIKVLGIEQPRLQLPDHYTMVAANLRKRNHEQVRVERYQAHGPAVPFAAHVTLVFGHDDRLLSYNRFTAPTGSRLPSVSAAHDVAERVMRALDPDYAAELWYMRTDTLERDFVDDTGQKVTIPIRWVKFAHTNGSYNWVSVGAGGQVVEFERESRWDYGRHRRATEEWNYDQWVMARAGRATQPPAPEALV